MNKLKAYLQELRAPFLTVTLLPAAIGTGFSFFQTRRVDWPTGLCLALGFVGCHLGTNVMNDYWDDRQGTDRANHDFVSPFSGGSRLIQQGLLQANEVRAWGWLLWLLGALPLLYLIPRFGWPALAVWALVFVSGYFYTAPPLRWAHRGLGEVFVGLNFGPVIMLAAYYAQQQRLSWSVLLMSGALAAWASAILWINQFPDYAADRATGKHNLVVRWGVQKSRWMYHALILGGYACLLGGWLLGWLPMTMALTLTTLPLALLAMWEVHRFYNQPQRLAKACALTVLLHLLAGVLMLLGLVI